MKNVMIVILLSLVVTFTVSTIHCAENQEPLPMQEPPGSLTI